MLRRAPLLLFTASPVIESIQAAHKWSKARAVTTLSANQGPARASGKCSLKRLGWSRQWASFIWKVAVIALILALERRIEREKKTWIAYMFMGPPLSLFHCSTQSLLMDFGSFTVSNRFLLRQTVVCCQWTFIFSQIKSVLLCIVTTLMNLTSHRDLFCSMILCTFISWKWWV